MIVVIRHTQLPSPSRKNLGPDLFKVFLESNHNLKAGKLVDSMIDELAGWSENRRGKGQEDYITPSVIDF